MSCIEKINCIKTRNTKYFQTSEILVYTSDYENNIEIILVSNRLFDGFGTGIWL